jgi:hypothetical protein
MPDTAPLAESLRRALNMAEGRSVDYVPPPPAPTFGATEGTVLPRWCRRLAGRIAAALTSQYTGSGGNSIVATMQPGPQVQSQRAVITMGSMVPEIFDNRRKAWLAST